MRNESLDLWDTQVKWLISVGTRRCLYEKSFMRCLEIYQRSVSVAIAPEQDTSCDDFTKEIIPGHFSDVSSFKIEKMGLQLSIHKHFTFSLFLDATSQTHRLGSSRAGSSFLLKERRFLLKFINKLERRFPFSNFSLESLCC
ncbi:hypothetical protein Tco_0355320 [Tanacetum coccineum]